MFLRVFESKGKVVLFNGWTRERLGKDVRNHLLSGKKVNFNVSSLDCIADSVVLDVNVLHPAMMLRVLDIV